MCLKWRQLPKPIICGVKGYTIYHGTALLAISDIAVAAEDLLYMPSLIEYNSLPWETSLNAKRSKEILFTQRFVMVSQNKIRVSPSPFISCVRVCVSVWGGGGMWSRDGSPSNTASDSADG